MATTKNKNSHWLSRLENQSWEAELIVSGLAIYGSLRLNSLLDDWMIKSVFEYSSSVLYFLKFVLLYLFIIQKILLISFFVHFSMRVLWVGIIGLSSVFPEGINENSKSIPPRTLQHLKEQYPDIRSYGVKLDRQCSLIFSILCGLIIIFLLSAIYVLVVIGLSQILGSFLPNAFLKLLLAIGFVFIYFLAFASSLLNFIGPYTESKWSRKYGLKLMDYLHRGMYLFFLEPFSYINYTLRTQIPSKQYFIGLIAIIGLALVSSSAQVVEVFELFDHKKHVSSLAIASKATPSNYRDHSSTEKSLHPSIQSYIISDNFIHIFIPSFERDLEQKQQFCGSLILEKECSREERAMAQEAFDSACANAYYRLILDDALISDLKWNRRTHPMSGQKGFSSVILLENLPKGEHQLKIPMFYDELDAPIHAIIPFFKS